MKDFKMAHYDQVPTMLVVLDGFGYSNELSGNAIKQAAMPMWQKLSSCYLSQLLHASGSFVGLLPNEQGNSEVGHITLGAGRIIASPQLQLHNLIAQGSLAKHPVLAQAFSQLSKPDAALHIITLLSDGGVHASQEFLYATLNAAATAGIRRIYVHAILDGRDVPPRSAAAYLAELEAFLAKLGCGTLASIHGRFYAMDRDNNWTRTEKVITALVQEQRHDFAAYSWQEALAESYAADRTDEFFKPLLLDVAGIIRDGDGIIMTNTRPDRARQLAACFLGKHTGVAAPALSFFITPTRYDVSFLNQVLLDDPVINDTLLDVLHAHNKSIVVAAESEKQAHITYFFKGMRDEAWPAEQRIVVQSLKRTTYEDDPAMAAPEITEKIVATLAKNPTAFYLINYANADMVGHSGNMAATIQACKTLDKQLAILYQEVVLNRGGILWLVADHGNAEYKQDAAGNVLTAHTKNPVLFVHVDEQHKLLTPADTATVPAPTRGLAAVAPTLLKAMELPIPKVMEGPLA